MQAKYVQEVKYKKRRSMMVTMEWGVATLAGEKI